MVMAMEVGEERYAENISYGSMLEYNNHGRFFSRLCGNTVRE
jgi:hypothetical protein